MTLRSRLVLFALAIVTAGLLTAADAASDSTAHIWGDTDCSGELTVADALFSLNASVSSALAGGCPALGANLHGSAEGYVGPVRWGDNDCTGGVAPADILPQLRVAGRGPSVFMIARLPGRVILLSPLEPVPFVQTYGGPMADEAWAVDTGANGDIYYATHQSVPGPWLDWIIYRLTPDGEEVWSARWGRNWSDQAFVVVVDWPVVYVGGYSQNALGLSQTMDMALAAFDAETGDFLWDFIWDQGFGYEELDGLVVEDDAIYISGWTTGEIDQQRHRGAEAGQERRHRLVGDLRWLPAGTRPTAKSWSTASACT